MNYQVYTLTNGVRLIHKPEVSPVSYCGMVINAGSRDEAENEQGMAHFVEHLLFKGTHKRRSSHIINRLEHVGGELNAFTSKEETVVYAAVLNEHLEKAIDLIGDIVFNSIFPEKEIDKERVIILDEIQSYNDSPSELIYDEFEDIVFDYPIGHAILGKAELLEKYSREDVHNFVQQHYHPDEMVFFLQGGINESKLLRWAEKYLANASGGNVSNDRKIPEKYSAGHQQIKRDTFQVHYMMGNRAFHLHHPDRMALYLLNNILGGPGMNSLLNLSLREKHGLVYHVDSVFQPLSDSGMWTVYFGTDQENFKKCEKLVRLELRKLRDQKLSEPILKKYKLQLLGQMAISQEHKENAAINLGKSLLRFGKVDSMEVVREHILEVTADKLQSIAQEVFDDQLLSTLKYY